jgi:hypothetical protein
MKYYNRNQKIVIIIAILVLIYNWFFYAQNSKLEQSSPMNTYQVIEQGCRNSKGSSSVHISYNRKTYYIRLANGECLKYPIGSKISLVYNDDLDYFYKPDGKKRGRNRLFFSFCFLLLSVLPYNNLYKKF